ncbi:MAG: 30S ribosomal protein S11 [SAR324 cluster bacterium]|nr:30S ribosomal protein S11 [SAR324 cluster bacterium]MCH8885063.1 30S ribosomal protein S11 [SAR324 cluster bacterium]
MARGKRTSGKRKEKKNIPVGICHITASFNNTIISFTDPQGNVVAWSSTGTVGFHGSRKSTPYAAKTATEDAVRKARDQGMRQVDVHVKGPGSGRESALRALAAEGLKITNIRDVTPVPHNGCKPPKMRRI